MKKITFLIAAFLIGFFGVCPKTPAQFPIKIPKIKIPKIEKPKPDEPQRDDGDSTTVPPRETSANQNAGMRSKDDVSFMPQPQPTSVPVLLKNTLNINVHFYKPYWRDPKDPFHTSWIPRVGFDIFYDRSETVRYTAEWSNPDGTLWFSEPLEGTRSDPTRGLDTLTTDKIGTFGLRVLNSKTKETVFQGKFTVKKFALNPGEPRYKNAWMFYADHDGDLPVGYVGFNDSDTWDHDPHPTVYMWFKGNINYADLEARLYHNNQQITSTDDGTFGGSDSGISAIERNAANCALQPELCGYHLLAFNWKNFRVESFDKVEHRLNQGYVRADPQAIYTKDKPGEYTVKVFYKGVPVREAKFTVQPNGWLEANKFAAQIPLKNYRAVIPVKITGGFDKYNAAAWKTDAFYGNPLTGFVVP